MSHITVERQEKVYHVPLATVQDVIDLMDANYAKRRAALMADLETVEATAPEKLQALADLRDRKGMTTDLMREAFTLDGACQIIKHVVNPEQHEALIDASPDKIVELALQILGFTLDEGDDTKEGSDVDPPKGGGTSTKKQ